MKGKGPSVAFLLGSDKEPKEEEEMSDDYEAGEDEQRSYLETAFPEVKWDEEKMSAMKSYVMACMGK